MTPQLYTMNHTVYGREWWLSGRVFYSGLRSCGFEPHQRHFVMSLSKTLYPLLSTGSTQEDPSLHD